MPFSILNNEYAFPFLELHRIGLRVSASRPIRIQVMLVRLETPVPQPRYRWWFSDFETHSIGPAGSSIRKDSHADIYHYRLFINHPTFCFRVVTTMPVTFVEIFPPGHPDLALQFSRLSQHQWILDLEDPVYDAHHPRRTINCPVTKALVLSCDGHVLLRVCAEHYAQYEIIDGLGRKTFCV